MASKKQEEARKRLYAPIDTTGMDPEMARTIKQDLARREKVRVATNPKSSVIARSGSRPQSKTKPAISKVGKMGVAMGEAFKKRGRKK